MHDHWMGAWQSVQVAEDSELQTDVMRFMAILAFCLVAIFALVQSMPLTPVANRPDPEPVSSRQQDDASPRVTRVTRVTPTEPEQAVRAPENAPEQRVRDTREPAVTLPRRRVFSRAPEPVKPQPAPAAPAVAAESAAPIDTSMDEPIDVAADDDGLSLRFASDEALKGLVRERAVSLYAISGDKFLKLDPDTRVASFTRASAPGSYHEMIAATVPADVRVAVPGDVTWGVTLPADMTQSLQRYANAGSSGVLVITADGRLDLERGR